jgi:two-component system alkaline phosphatase synthesis response regulator PhoP
VPKKILVIDDMESLRKAICKMLSQEGFAHVETDNGSDGLLLAGESKPDLVLTDAEMPGLGGHALCRTIKKSPALSRVPVIIMSGEMIDEKDVVAGLDGGADDYIIKPFTMKVLLSRIRAVLRRFEQFPEAEKTLKTHGITLDPASREVRIAGKKVALTRKEFDLLALFIEKSGRVLTNAYLLETIWGYDLADYNDPHTVETHISRLRGKLGKEAAACLVNVHGMGYKLER